MNHSSRRHFVKRSAATGISLSFAGLIRAHGGGGGDGTTEEATTETTTWDPQGTTYDTTSSDSYGATCVSTYDITWDPEGTTHDTTHDLKETTVETTAHTCFWPVRMSILFDEIFPHPHPSGNSTSGRIFEGFMMLTVRSCDGNEVDRVYLVHCGGYLDSDSLLAKGSDTAIPAGAYNVQKNPKGWGKFGQAMR